MIGYRLSRQLTFYGILLLIFIIGNAWYFGLKQIILPRCDDGIRNGLEEGVDCGGVCDKICEFQVKGVNTIWANSFKIRDNIYNVAAKIQNPNSNYSLDCDYELIYLNEQGINTIAAKDKIHLKPLEETLVFVPTVKIMGEKIKKTFFIQNKISNFKREKVQEKIIRVSSKRLYYSEFETKLEIEIQNMSYKHLRNLFVFGILKDENDNVVNLSRGYIDYLGKEEKWKVILSWPEKIKVDLSKVEVIVYQTNDIYDF